MLHKNKERIKNHCCIPKSTKNKDRAPNIIFRKIPRFKHYKFKATTHVRSCVRCQFLELSIMMLC